jgi:hypothetical protein
MSSLVRDLVSAAITGEDIIGQRGELSQGIGASGWSGCGLWAACPKYEFVPKIPHNRLFSSRLVLSLKKRSGRLSLYKFAVRRKSERKNRFHILKARALS